MPARSGAFNTYLAVMLGLLVLCGCATPEERAQKKVKSILRLHLTAPAGQSDMREPIQIAGVTMYVERASFIDERSVDSAKLVTLGDGSFSMQINFNDHGRMTLESITSGNPGRQIAVFVQFGADKLSSGSWLAAPRISRRITDGVIVFTPAVPRADAETIVLGLNNVATAQKKPLADW